MASPRVAAADAFYGQPHAFEGPVDPYRLHCILGTGGSEPAVVAEQRRDEFFVTFK